MSRVGLITTGTGDRPDLRGFHTDLLEVLGVPECEVVFRNALDGLSRAEIDALAPGRGEPRIHSNIASATGVSPLGAGWDEVWISRAAYLERLAICVAALEQDGVDAIVACVAEEIPRGTISASVPVILPWITATDLVGTLVGSRERIVVGLLVSTEEQQRQQYATWAGLPWSNRVDLHLESTAGGHQEAARRLAVHRPDVALLWGYGVGLGASWRSGPVRAIESELDCPLVLPHVAATLALRQVLAPAFDLRAIHDSADATRKEV